MNRKAPADLRQQKKDEGLREFQRLLQRGGQLVFFVDPTTGNPRSGVPLGISGRSLAIIEVSDGHIEVPLENIRQKPP